jgi:hypothetical protein
MGILDKDPKIKRTTVFQLSLKDAVAVLRFLWKSMPPSCRLAINNKNGEKKALKKHDAEWWRLQCLLGETCISGVREQLSLHRRGQLVFCPTMKVPDNLSRSRRVVLPISDRVTGIRERLQRGGATNCVVK